MKLPTRTSTRRQSALYATIPGCDARDVRFRRSGDARREMEAEFN